MGEPDTALSLSDLPRQHEPGDVGIRVSEDGGVWIPLGVNVGARNRVGKPYFAQIQRRREWHEAKTLGGRRATGQTRTSVAKCSVCKFLIGRGYIETEIYARPVLVAKANKDTLTWTKVCGDCAIRYFNLPHGFCVLANTADWSGDYHKRITRKNLALVWQEKIVQLEDALCDAMFAFLLTAEQHYWHAHHGNLSHFYRQPILEQWVAIQEPAVATFSDIYPALTRETHYAAA